MSSDKTTNDRHSAEHLPKYFRTTANKKFLSSTLDQLIQPGTVEKVNGYIGRKYSKLHNPGDYYLPEVSPDRENYQLEPAAIVVDNMDNVEFYKDYRDFVNHVRNLGGTVSNHNRLTSSEYYPWNPHIDWDKFVNFREYYWMPSGPPLVTLDQYYPQTVTHDTVSVNNGFVFGSYTGANPTLTLYRGVTYHFSVITNDHTFSIRDQRDTVPAWTTNANYTAGHQVVYNKQVYECITTHFSGTGFDQSAWALHDPLSGTVSGSSVTHGTVTVKLDHTSPDFLFYLSDDDINYGGMIRVLDPPANQPVDVDEIIGKKTYTIRNGISLSNGMRIRFSDNVVQKEYAQTTWYISGVGTGIELIPESRLAVWSTSSDSFYTPYDQHGFGSMPFSEAVGYLDQPDYITIDRSSPDGNLWSRQNRWIHSAVIHDSYMANSQVPVYDHSMRARRPIIEFHAGVQLFNHGVRERGVVDLIDDFTKDIFSTIHGSPGYNVDDVDLADGMRVMFTNERDSMHKNQIYQIRFVQNHENISVITLVKVPNSVCELNDTLYCRGGTEYGGSTVWLSNTGWKKSQPKTSINQPPLFDVFDMNGVSFSDTRVYEYSNFAGTPIFSYQTTDQTIDPVLGFGIVYNDIENIGDIQFRFDFNTQTFNYKPFATQQRTVDIHTGYLKQNTPDGVRVTDGYTIGYKNLSQAVLREYSAVQDQTQYEIDVFDSVSPDQMHVQVYVNGDRVSPEQYAVNQENDNTMVTFDRPPQSGDQILFRIQSNLDKNESGFYEIPANLENNSNNELLDTVSFSEIANHVQTIIENHPEFSGVFPGVGNLRDLGSISAYGTRIIKHASPLNIPMYHMLSRRANLIKSIDYTRREYGKFKRNFLNLAATMSFDGTVKEQVDAILKELNHGCGRHAPFYFSDMIAFSAPVVNEFTVKNKNQLYFALSESFTLAEPSNRAVNVYLNDVQLVHEQDYVFTEQGFVQVTHSKQRGDTVSIYEYSTTNGSFIPPTPAKLGLWPTSVPRLYSDDTYAETQRVIVGHDGSKVIAFDDYRDDLLLELERRIYNNIKIQYRTDEFDIHQFMPGLFRTTSVSEERFNHTLLPDFIQWLHLVNKDYSTNTIYDQTDPFSYNYKGCTNQSDQPVSGTWKHLYQHAYDTIAPHNAPWEMLGFGQQPVWWESTYGAAPYTRNNQLLWDDIEQGVIRDPAGTHTVESYQRPGLSKHIPVDEQGRLVDPINSNYIRVYNTKYNDDNFLFGDYSPTESAWRHSSEYAYSVLKGALLNHTAQVFSTGFDRFRQRRDATGKINYNHGQFSTNRLVFPNSSFDSDSVYTSGLVNFIRDANSSETGVVYDNYISQLNRLNNRLCAKLAGFTTKDKFKVLFDSKKPSQSTGMYIPEENYTLFLNTSTPVRVLSYSGIIIERLTHGYTISGYDNTDPSFEYNPVIPQVSDKRINVGGISQNFIKWTPERTYSEGVIVEYDDKYYRVKRFHTTNEQFDEKNYAKLPHLPTIGGRDVFVRKEFSEQTASLDYGDTLSTVQEVVDFIQGYEHKLLNDGFVFEARDNEVIQNWSTSVREFLAWSLYNWGDNSAISLSPGAQQFRVSTVHSVIGNIYDTYSGYSIFQADGTGLSTDAITIDRENPNETVITSNHDGDGIYGLSVELVQKEHVLLLDDVTEFGDYVFRQITGYRQPRLRVTGYVSSHWDGSLNVPGFMFDSARIRSWTEWVDYKLGDLVKYKEYYYVAAYNITGSDQFVNAQWNRLPARPSSGLLPNIEYKTSQFADFYNLDTDNFDSEQQRFAQHLIGYQNREYLQNIVNDDVSQYKLYQGFIADKGTLNAIEKFFNPLTVSTDNSLQIHEEWAIKTGQYGTVGGLREFEFSLSEQRTEPVCLQIIGQHDPRESKLIQYYTLKDISLLAEHDNTSLLPEMTSCYDFLPEIGYVNQTDVDYTVSDLNQILELGQVPLDSLIWCTAGDNQWEVYAHDRSTMQIIELLDVQTDQITVLVANYDNTIMANDIIGISNQPLLNGFARVLSVVQNQLTIQPAELGNNIQAGELSGNISVLTPRRVQNNTIANTRLSDNIHNINRLWMDNQQYNWTVLEREHNYHVVNQVHNGKVIWDYAPVTISLAMDSTNSTMIIGRPDDDLGKVFVYRRPTVNSDYELIQVIQSESSHERYGDHVIISETGNIVVIAHTTARVAGVESAGYVEVYQRTRNGQYTRVKQLQSSTPTTNDQFGKELALHVGVQLTTLYVGAYGRRGVIHTFHKGMQHGYDYDWDSSTDKRYVGDHDVAVAYNQGQIVTHDDVEYEALVDVLAGTPVTPSNWEPVTYLVDKTGMVTVNDDFIGYTDYQMVQFVVNDRKELIVSYNNPQQNRGTVIVYRNSIGVYEPVQNLYYTGGLFGYAMAVSGDRLIISTPVQHNTQDEVCVYTRINNEYQLHQTIPTPYWCKRGYFGSGISYKNDILVIRSDVGMEDNPTTFDVSVTTFDQGFLQFKDGSDDIGAISIYQWIDNQFLYCEAIPYHRKSRVDFGSAIVTGSHTVHIGSIDPELEGVCVINEHSIETLPWQIKTQHKTTVDHNRIKQVLLYDVQTQEAQKLDVLDVFQGAIPQPVQDRVKFKTFYDPAIYSIGTDVNVDPINSWFEEHVGELWWDLSNAKFYNPYQNNVTFSANTWNMLLDGSSIDVYEWVESIYEPEVWDNISAADFGESRGISGVTLYGNQAYSTRKKYDPVAKTFTRYYYYWVKNKNNTDAADKLSAQSVADLISDPVGSGYQFAALISPTQIALYNCHGSVQPGSVLKVQYWDDIDQSISNIHNQYKLLTENTDTNVINRDIERKWFDSLVGFDTQNRQVPDPDLRPDAKYGTLFNPRQSWFVNRTQAVKQVIERVNRVLLQNQICDNRDITGLFDKEPEPASYSGYYDTVIDTFFDIQFVNVTKFKPPQLQLNIQDGVIVSVSIQSPGAGYSVAPSLQVSGIGHGADLVCEINKRGQITQVQVVNGGEYYTEKDHVIVRNFSVLVSSDETRDNKWAIYQRDNHNMEWQLVRLQNYNVEPYWDYVDWYAPGYDANTAIDYSLAATYELSAYDFEPGAVIRIQNEGHGGWLLLERTDQQTIGEYLTIGRQRGTLQFSAMLYDPDATDIKYDTIKYDGAPYDTWPYRELRLILETLRDHILIDDLLIEYNNLFFSSVRHVLSEQSSVDWLFKTSFIKVKHYSGELSQRKSYAPSNAADYEKYIREVKPYKTKIREYVTGYTANDSAAVQCTDFDLPPVYSAAAGEILPQTVIFSDGQWQQTNAYTDQYPHRDWFNTVGYGVSSIELIESGHGYTVPPQIEIISGYGHGATAQAVLGSGGRISEIRMTTQGSGYLSTPEVHIITAESVTPATAVAILGNGVARTIKTSIRLDRVGMRMVYDDLDVVQQFTTELEQSVFVLKWPIHLDKKTIHIDVDGQEIIHSYSYENVIDQSKSYTRRVGVITLDFVVEPGNQVTISYRRNISLLSAVDRVAAYYDPTSGQYANDISQLTTGIDYGGVTVTGGEFVNTGSWGSVPWMSTKWDQHATDPLIDRFTYTGDNTFTLTTPISETGQRNVYIDGVRVDDPDWGTAQQTNPAAVMKTIDANSSEYNSTAHTVTLFSSSYTPAHGQTVWIVDSSTDAGDSGTLHRYDTAISGGDLAYTTALGLSPESIVYHGGEFNSVTTNSGPEELVTGTVMDTLDIRVHETVTSGSSHVYSAVYVGDGHTTVYDLQTMHVIHDNVVVKVNGVILPVSEYTVTDTQVILDTAPAQSHQVNIVVFGFASSGLVHTHTHTGTAGETVVVTDYDWQLYLSALAIVNGVVQTVSVTDQNGQAGIEFSTALANSDHVEMFLFSGPYLPEQYSVVHRNEIVCTTNTEYALAVTPFTTSNIQSQVIAILDNQVLSTGHVTKFTVSDVREYSIPEWQFPVGSLLIGDIKVYLNDQLLNANTDWTFEDLGDSSTGTYPSNTVVLAPTIGVTGDQLEIHVIRDADFEISDDGSRIELLNTPTAGSRLQVLQFTNYDIQNVEKQSLNLVEHARLQPGTTEYMRMKHLSNGVIKLSTPAIDSSYVWVAVNKTLLTPNVDYIVSPDGNYIRLAKTPNWTPYDPRESEVIVQWDQLEAVDLSTVDWEHTNLITESIPEPMDTDPEVIEIYHFANQPLGVSFSWRQFTDILNRTHYKRIRDMATVSHDVLPETTSITVDTGGIFSDPGTNSKRPGVIFINGERIEYYHSTDNELTNLVRGTLGTSIPDITTAGTVLHEQGPAHTLPYMEEYNQNQFVYETPTEYELSYVALSEHEVEVFVGGRRLRKCETRIYNKNLDQDSPEADDVRPPEFSIKTVYGYDSKPMDSKKYDVNQIPPRDPATTTVIIDWDQVSAMPGEIITVVMRYGKSWKRSGEPLSASNSAVARFLQS